MCQQPLLGWPNLLWARRHVFLCEKDRRTEKGRDRGRENTHSNTATPINFAGFKKKKKKLRWQRYLWGDFIFTALNNFQQQRMHYQKGVRNTFRGVSRYQSVVWDSGGLYKAAAKLRTFQVLKHTSLALQLTDKSRWISLDVFFASCMKKCDCLQKGLRFCINFYL